MEFVRTPDERYENLEGYPFEPHYVNVPDGGAASSASTTWTRARWTGK